MSQGQTLGHVRTDQVLIGPSCVTPLLQPGVDLPGIRLDPLLRCLLRLQLLAGDEGSAGRSNTSSCKGAKKILAINKDPHAPILARSDYAVVGDLHEVVAAMIEELRR